MTKWSAKEKYLFIASGISSTNCSIPRFQWFDN